MFSTLKRNVIIVDSSFLHTCRQMSYTPGKWNEYHQMRPTGIRTWRRTFSSHRLLKVQGSGDLTVFTLKLHEDEWAGKGERKWEGEESRKEEE